MDARMKLPGPNHPIDIRPAGRPMKAMWRGREIGRSSAALVLSETVLADVVYMPRADIEARFLERTDRSTFCPYKGDASYFTLVDGQDRDENAVWSYETPYEAMAPIKGYLAFYADKVTFEPA